MPESLEIKTIISHFYSENAYLVSNPQTSECLVVDPGFDAERIQQQITEDRLSLQAILNTHGHSDHIAGNALLKRCWPNCTLVIGRNDADKLEDPVKNLSAPMGGITSPAADRLVGDGDMYDAAGLRFEVLEVPGHSRGHVVYVWKAESPWLVFGGDVVFRASIGRTDFPDGDTQLLLDSIREKLFTLPDDTIILPGHGEPTTVAFEKRHNPFVGGNAGQSGNR
jgi:glyoxylase-like metal-dependent hydrolase (beta-lactamase superfamily II)